MRTASKTGTRGTLFVNLTALSILQFVFPFMLFFSSCKPVPLLKSVMIYLSQTIYFKMTDFPTQNTFFFFSLISFFKTKRLEMFTSVRRYPFEAFHFKGEGSYKFRVGPHLPSFSRTDEGASRGPCQPGAVLAARRRCAASWERSARPSEWFKTTDRT